MLTLVAQTARPVHCMEAQDWTIRKKPFDIRERLFEFACLTVRVVQFLHARGPIGRALSYQVPKSGISAGANYEEADDGSSGRDEVAKMRISLRELKETRFRLRVLRATGLLFKEQDPVIAECDELVKIVASIIKNKHPKQTL